MKVYIDKENKCHVTDDGTRKAVEDSFFDGKCDTFVEGYCYKSDGEMTSIYPWKPYAVLEAAQVRQQQLLLATYEALINELYEEVCI